MKAYNHESTPFNTILKCHTCSNHLFFFLGIFAYLNFLTPKKRSEILATLVNGLKRLEYRGYDSAGVAIDSSDAKDMALIKKTGKVRILEEEIKKSNYLII